MESTNEWHVKHDKVDFLNGDTLRNHEKRNFNSLLKRQCGPAAVAGVGGQVFWSIYMHLGAPADGRLAPHKWRHRPWCYASCTCQWHRLPLNYFILGSSYPSCHSEVTFAASTWRDGRLVRLVAWRRMTLFALFGRGKQLDFGRCLPTVPPGNTAALPYLDWLAPNTTPTWISWHQNQWKSRKICCIPQDLTMTA